MTDDSQRLIDLVDSQFDPDTILLDTRKGDQFTQYAVHQTIEILNVVRRAVIELLPKTYVPGLAAIPKGLCEELTEVGDALISDRHELAADLRRFIDSLKQAGPDGISQVDSVAAALLKSRGEGPDKATEADTLFNLIQTGRRLCQALVGMDNRIGLLAEVNLLIVARLAFEPSEYHQRVVSIADRAIRVSGANETFAAHIASYNQENGDREPLPRMDQVECMALINGINRVQSACLAKMRESALSPDLLAELESVESSLKRLEQLTDSDHHAMFGKIASTTRLYQECLRAELLGDPLVAQQHLDELQEPRCRELLEIIRGLENDPAVKRFAEDLLTNHFPSLEHPDAL